MSATLIVWWDDTRVGDLTMDRFGDVSFVYASDWLKSPGARPLSQSLPLRAEVFSRRACLPFFEGLLPEESQRTAVASALQVSPQNAFRLLERIGGEVAGALTLLPEGVTPQPPGIGPSNPPLERKDLIALLDRLPRRPLLVGEGGLRLSLAGAQVKAPVVVRNGRVCLPAPGEATTHILKPPIERFEGTSENEAFAMRLAQRVGLNVAEVDYHLIEGRSFILVERYDRRRGRDGVVRRLHQEDFCQALGTLSSQKYPAEGGPVFKDCFGLLRQAASTPARDLLKLLDAALFNLLIGNADAHGKNYSLLYADGLTQLAPLYDLLTTVAYEELSPKLAMKIAKRARLQDIQPRDWPVFAEETGLTAPFIRKRITQLARKVREEAGAAADSFGLPIDRRAIIDRFVGLVVDRALSLEQRV